MADDLIVFFPDDTLLLKAIKHNDPEAVAALLHDPHTDVNLASQEDGMEPVYWAVLVDNPDILGMILTHPNLHMNEGGQSLLTWAGELGHIHSILRLLQDPRVEAPTTRMHHDMSAWEYVTENLVQAGLPVADRAAQFADFNKPDSKKALAILSLFLQDPRTDLRKVSRRAMSAFVICCVREHHLDLLYRLLRDPHLDITTIIPFIHILGIIYIEYIASSERLTEFSAEEDIRFMQDVLLFNDDAEETKWPTERTNPNEFVAVLVKDSPRSFPFLFMLLADPRVDPYTQFPSEDGTVTKWTGMILRVVLQHPNAPDAWAIFMRWMGQTLYDPRRNEIPIFLSAKEKQVYDQWRTLRKDMHVQINQHETKDHETIPKDLIRMIASYQYDIPKRKQKEDASAAKVEMARKQCRGHAEYGKCKRMIVHGKYCWQHSKK